MGRPVLWSGQLDHTPRGTVPFEAHNEDADTFTATHDYCRVAGVRVWTG
ncbi:MAG: hypothetical protein M3N52_00775 [Actinomycetota bacterium]|nr:hypothetical protein [Actinomycetota bacterium]